MCRLAGAAGPFSQNVSPMVCIMGLDVRGSADAWRCHASAEHRTPKPVMQTIGPTLWETKAPAPTGRRILPCPPTTTHPTFVAQARTLFSARDRLHTCAAAASVPSQGLAGDAGCGGAGEHARSGHTWARRARCARCLARRAQGCHGREREREQARKRERERESERERERESARESERERWLAEKRVLQGYRLLGYD